MRSGSELLVESLANENVDFIFGYPGGAVLPSMTHSMTVK